MTTTNSPEKFRYTYDPTLWDLVRSDTALKADFSKFAHVTGSYIINDLRREQNKHSGLTYSGNFQNNFQEFLGLVVSEKLHSAAARDVFSELINAVINKEEIRTSDIVARKGLAVAQTDTGELEQWCRDSIAANAKAAEEFRAGKESAINGLKGPVMKAAKGKVNPKLVDETLRRVLAAS